MIDVIPGIESLELKLANYFDYRKYVIVPNVSWGFLHYEADLLILTNSGYVWEVEIKRSRADLLRDQKKHHQHNSPKVRLVWFAIPDSLSHCIELIPDYAGVLVIGRWVTENRSPKPNPRARKLTPDERFKLARLGAIRVWPLKERLLR